MNRTFAFALVVAAATAAAASAGNALADDITIDTTPFHSTATRAEVLAELASFNRSGANPWADDYKPVAALHSEQTRAEVRAQYIAARDQVAALNGEDSGSMTMARAHRQVVPATVLAESAR
jgi:hypothetical protein